MLLLFKVSVRLASAMKNRSRLEIISLILNTATQNEGVNQKKILYRTYLSYEHLKKYLSLLQENELIECHEQDGRVYRTTEKGLRFLNLYSGLNEVVAMTNNMSIK